MICTECLQGRHLHAAGVPGCTCDSSAHGATRGKEKWLSFQELAAANRTNVSNLIRNASLDWQLHASTIGHELKVLESGIAFTEEVQPIGIPQAPLLEHTKKKVDEITRDLRKMIERFEAVSKKLGV